MLAFVTFCLSSKSLSSSLEHQYRTVVGTRGVVVIVRNQTFGRWRLGTDARISNTTPLQHQTSHHHCHHHHQQCQMVSSSDPAPDIRPRDTACYWCHLHCCSYLVSALLCHVPVSKSCRLSIACCRDRPPCSLIVQGIHLLSVYHSHIP